MTNYDNKVRENVYYRDKGFCAVCGKPGNIEQLQLAHVVTKGVTGQKHVIRLLIEKCNTFITKKQAIKILNNEKCFKLACAGNCNDKVNSFFKTVFSDNLIIEIASDLRLI